MPYSAQGVSRDTQHADERRRSAEAFVRFAGYATGTYSQPRLSGAPSVELNLARGFELKSSVLFVLVVLFSNQAFVEHLLCYL